MLEAALKVGDWLAEVAASGAQMRVVDGYGELRPPAESHWARELLAALPSPDLVVSLDDEQDDDERLRAIRDILLGEHHE